MVARSISETAAVMSGSLGKGRRETPRKLGHRVGKVAIREAIAAPEGMDPNPI